MSDKHDDEVWGVEKCARLLQCSERLVQKLANEGRLPSFRVGRLHRFRAKDVREWMKGKAAHQ